MQTTVFLLTILMGLGLGQAEAETVGLIDFDPGEYRIGPDDLLDIRVFEVPDLNSSVRVTASGVVTLPLLGVVAVAARTPRELELQLERALDGRYVNAPHVTVFVSEYGSQPVSVLGAVRNPGIYQIRGRKFLLEMVAMAGGLNDASGKVIQVIRRVPDVGDPRIPGGSGARAEAIPIDIEQLFEHGRTDLNIPILAGDVVNVLAAGSVFVVGEVNGPGEFVLRNGRNVTVTQAVALGGGFARDARKDSALIIRVHPDGARIEIPVNLEEILEKELGDVLMQPNDILFVPTSRTREGFARAIDAAVSVVVGRMIWR